MQNTTKKLSNRFPSGLTLAECLFAMAIMLVGLIGIASMVPFAGRQAATSYSVVHSLSTGQNAIEIAKSGQVLRPRTNNPWLYIDDSASALVDSQYFVSADRLYQTIYTSRLNGSVNPDDRFVAANTSLGIGFCMDPNFWGHQARYTAVLRFNDWGYYRRSVFPFYSESYPTNFFPFGASPVFSTPRLSRISLRDPIGPDGNGNNGWLREAAAIAVASAGPGDLVQETPETDRSSAPLRNFTKKDVTGSIEDGSLISSLQRGSGDTNPSWLATIVPTDETPIATPDGGDLPITPEVYDLSIVVFSKRDVRELVFDPLDPADYNNFNAAQQPAKSERLAKIDFTNPIEAANSSTFGITLSNDIRVGLNCKVGDWIMLSRYRSYPDNVNPSRTFSRQQHLWYRILSASAETTSGSIVSCDVRLSGQPWNWSLSELEWYRDHNLIPPNPFPPPLTGLPQAIATLIPNVINVYQTQIRMSGF
jgi:hypothetical protein